MRTALVVALLLAVVTAGFLWTTQHDSALPSKPPVTEVPRPVAATTTTSGTNAAAGRIDDPPTVGRMSDEERAVAIRRAMSRSMAVNRDAYAQELAAGGLAPADSERIAQRLTDGLADCIFEAARKEYEARGVSFKDFLDGAEIVWSQPIEPGIRDVSPIRSGAASCIAIAGQQAGMALPADYGSAANAFVERFSAALEPPPWASQMEARIREHIASYPGVEITDTLTTCREEGCSVMLVGRDIRIFALEFERFAEQNGFEHAVLGGDSDRRFVWLQR
jgi:hypothetical protein